MASGGGVGRHVHEDGVAQVAADNELGELRQRLGRGLGQLFGPGGEVEAVFIHQTVAAVGNGHHAHLQTQLFEQVRLLPRQLLQQLAAHVAGAQDEQVHLLLGGLKKGLVQHVDGLAHVGGPNHGRDILLRSTLRDGPDVDPILPQRPEQLAADAGVVFHVLAHQRHDGQVGFGPQRLDAAGRDFVANSSSTATWAGRRPARSRPRKWNAPRSFG